MSLRASCPLHGRYDKSCPECRVYTRNYRQRRVEGLRAGTWDRVVQGAELEAVRQHLLALVAVPGVAPYRIAQMIGVANRTIYRVVQGETQRLRPDIAALIVGLDAQTVLAEVVPPLVDSTGTARRLQALCADGWSAEALAALLGADPSTIGHWRMRHYPTIVRATHDQIAELYDKIQDMDDPSGPSFWAGVQARSHDYLPPHRWAGVDMDDPQAVPLPPLGRFDDPVEVQRLIEASLVSGRVPDRADVPRPILRQLALRAVRDGWTLAQVGGLVGLSVSAVEYLLNGRRDRPHTRGATHE